MGRAGKYGESDDDALPLSPQFTTTTSATRKTNKNYRPSTGGDAKDNMKKNKDMLKLAPGSHIIATAAGALSSSSSSKDPDASKNQKQPSKKSYDDNGLRDSKLELAPGEHREEVAQRGVQKKAGALQASTRATKPGPVSVPGNGVGGDDNGLRDSKLELAPGEHREGEEAAQRGVQKKAGALQASTRATKPGPVSVPGNGVGGGKLAEKGNSKNLQLATGYHREEEEEEEEETNELISEKKRAGIVNDNIATAGGGGRHSTNTTRSSGATHRQQRASNLNAEDGEPPDSDESSEEEDEDMIPGARAVDGVRASDPNLNEYDPTDHIQDDDDVEANQNRNRQSEGLAEAILVDEDEEEDGDGQSMDEEVPKDAIIAEEVTEEEIEKSAKGWIIRNKRIVLFMIVLFCAAVVLVAVFVSRPNEDPTTSQSPPTAPPTPERISSEELKLRQQSYRFRKVYGIVGNYTSSSSFEVLLDDNTTAQHLALRWIADVDPAQLNFTTSDPKLITQRYGLAVIYFATNGDEWDQNLNFLTETNECDWNDSETDDSSPQSGVVSCNEDGFITSLQLNDLNLNGTIPDEVSIFSYLELLDLGSNILAGTLPSTMGELSSLIDLRLFSNVLTGNIPLGIGNMTDLEILFFQDNQLNGEIPPSIGGLTGLKNLNGSFNRLIGQIPSEIGMLADLTLFFVQRNLLTGTMPATMASLTSLRQVDVSYNSLVDGANNLCEIGSLVVYLADCYEQLIPVIEGDICCNCCSQCCTDGDVTSGCFGNTNEPC